MRSTGLVALRAWRSCGSVLSVVFELSLAARDLYEFDGVRDNIVRELPSLRAFSHRTALPAVPERRCHPEYSSALRRGSDGPALAFRLRARGMEIGRIIRRGVDVALGSVVPDAYLKVNATPWPALAHDALPCVPRSI